MSLLNYLPIHAQMLLTKKVHRSTSKVRHVFTGTRTNSSYQTTKVPFFPPKQDDFEPTEETWLGAVPLPRAGCFMVHHKKLRKALGYLWKRSAGLSPNKVMGLHWNHLGEENRALRLILRWSFLKYTMGLIVYFEYSVFWIFSSPFPLNHVFHS